MPLYRNPDFRRLPGGLACAFDQAKESSHSFFTLPVWYDLMAEYALPRATEIRVYTDERPGSVAALLAQTTTEGDGRNLASLTNAHSLEHGILHAPGADLDRGLAAILSEILAERPQWDCLSLSELDPREPSYPALVGALRRAGLLVESVFSSGTWYEETSGLSFPDYVSARPSELRNTWHRKRRKLGRGNRLTTYFIDDDNGLDRAVADYETVYAASWKQPELFRDFVPALIRLAGKLRALRLGIYHLDGKPAAGHLWIGGKGSGVDWKPADDQ